MSIFHGSVRISRPAVWGLTAFCVMAGLCSQLPAAAAQGKTPEKPDTIVFTNGDQLTGKLERGVGDSIVFKSDTAGEITVPVKKLKELRSFNNFAVIRKEDKKNGKLPHEAGKITFADDNLTVTTPTGPPQIVPIKDVDFIIDKTTYDNEVLNHPGFLHGWTGSVSGGVSLIRATQTGTSFTAGVTLLRTIPAVPYLPPKNRTTFNLVENYGKLTQPVIPQTTPPTPASVAKTSIFHTDAEHDIYFTPRFYALGELSYDHNFAQGLQLQQVYGGGFGWTPLQTPVQQLDLKADVHYEMQRFIQPAPPEAPIPNQNLIGSTFGEDYHRNLPGKIVFTESASVLPAFNNPEAYSAIAAAGLNLPAYKRLSIGLNATDNYLNMPAAGYRKNSVQFVTSIVYNLK